MTGESFHQTTDAFLDWLTRMGASTNPKASLVDFRSEGRGRGLVARGDFAEDEIIFSIPRSAVLNVKTATADKNEELCKFLSSCPVSLQDIPSWLSLTIILMIEIQRGNSKWQAYISVLPLELDSLVFWTEEELKDLQASAVVNKIGKADAEELYHSKVAPLNIPGADLDLFHKAASIIMAYAFDIPEDEPEENTEIADELVPDEEKTVLTMIPLADMLNADAHRNNARLLCDNEDLEMRAIKPISRGEEIFNDYGQLPLSDLLRRYGYVTDNYAAYDVAEISTASIILAFQNALVLDQFSKLWSPLQQKELERRLDLVKREDLYEESYDVFHADDDQSSVPDELVALIYLLLVNDETFSSLERSYTALPNRNKLATLEVGNALVQIFKLREQEYATTLEEDENLLSSGIEKLPYRTAMAVKVRHGEKKVLREAMLEAETFRGDDKRMRNQNGKRQVQGTSQRPQKRNKHG